MMKDRLSNGTEEGCKDARDICYYNDIEFVPERGSGVVDALKKRADVISYLEKYNVPQGGTLPILRYRLRNHLVKVAKKARHLNPCPVTASACQTISYPFCQSGYFVVCH